MAALHHLRGNCSRADLYLQLARVHNNGHIWDGEGCLCNIGGHNNLSDTTPCWWYLECPALLLGRDGGVQGHDPGLAILAERLAAQALTQPSYFANACNITALASSMAICPRQQLQVHYLLELSVWIESGLVGVTEITSMIIWRNFSLNKL